MEWPWQRFDKLYEIFVNRSLIEGLEKRKEQMIAALWSNSNWDDDKGSRKQAIEELEDNFKAQIDKLKGLGQEVEVEMEDTFGFFAAGERKLKELEVPGEPDGTVGEVLKEQSEHQKYIDQ